MKFLKQFYICVSKKGGA